MRTLLSIIIIFILPITAFGQKDVKMLAPQISKADTALLIIYSNYDDYNNIRSIVSKGIIDSATFKSGFLLNRTSRTRLASILTNPRTFNGRYSSCGGCGPKQALLLWHKGKYSFIEFITASHKALYSKSDSYFYINEYKNDVLSNFLKKFNGVDR